MKYSSLLPTVSDTQRNVQDLPSVLFKLQGKTSTASLCSNQETFGPRDGSDVGQAGAARAGVRQPSLTEPHGSSVVCLCALTPGPLELN